MGTCHLKVSPVTVGGFRPLFSSMLWRRAALKGTLPVSENCLKCMERAFASPLPGELVAELLGRKPLKADVPETLGLKLKPVL